MDNLAGKYHYSLGRTALLVNQRYLYGHGYPWTCALPISEVIEGSREKILRLSPRCQHRPVICYLYTTIIELLACYKRLYAHVPS